MEPQPGSGNRTLPAPGKPHKVPSWPSAPLPTRENHRPCESSRKSLRHLAYSCLPQVCKSNYVVTSSWKALICSLYHGPSIYWPIQCPPLVNIPGGFKRCLVPPSWRPRTAASGSHAACMSSTWPGDTGPSAEGAAGSTVPTGRVGGLTLLDSFSFFLCCLWAFFFF